MLPILTINNALTLSLPNNTKLKRLPNTGPHRQSTVIRGLQNQSRSFITAKQHWRDRFCTSHITVDSQRNVSRLQHQNNNKFPLAINGNSKKIYGLTGPSDSKYTVYTTVRKNFLETWKYLWNLQKKKCYRAWNLRRPFQNRNYTIGACFCSQFLVIFVKKQHILKTF